MNLVNKQKRILVLDKDNKIFSLVDEIMYFGYSDIHVTFDPNAVYDIAKSYQPDLIILDYLLMDNDCSEICSDFKKDSNLKNVPIIVVTAYRNKRINLDSFNCDALFIKPLDIEILASRMEYLIAS